MTLYLPQIELESLAFPPIETALAEPDGLLAMGGDLSPKRILAAYSHGIFPWFSPGDPILWWSPSQRAIVIPKTFTPSKSLKKCLRKHDWKISVNSAIQEVIEHCAYTRSEDETWITDTMIDAYQELAEQGYCHSVEVWLDGKLVGGLYGLLIGGVFCGESMFSLVSSASKLAFWHLNLWLDEIHVDLIDCQMMNPHLESLGAVEISRQEFKQHLLKLVHIHIPKDKIQPRQLNYI